MSQLRSLSTTHKLILVSALALSLLALVLLCSRHHIDILKTFQDTKTGGDGGTKGEANSLADFTNAIGKVQGPANLTISAIGGLGVAAGAALIAVGSPKGLKTAGASAGAIVVLFLGNGLIK